MTAELKRLSYLSRSIAGNTSSIPAELAAIVMQSRRFNHAHGIMGFLTWRNGYYFQALEGEAGAVDSLFGKIAADHRHDQIEIVWSDEDVRERIFTGWRLKLWSASLTCNEVNQFIRLYAKRFETLDGQLQQRLRKIFDFDLIFSSEPGDVPASNEICEYEFRLQALPSVFGLTSQQPGSIDVLTSLLAGWGSPARLSEQFDLSLDNIRELLARNEVRSLLLKRRAELSREDTGTGKISPTVGASKNRSFYNRLRSVFLRSLQ